MAPQSITLMAAAHSSLDATQRSKLEDIRRRLRDSGDSESVTVRAFETNIQPSLKAVVMSIEEVANSPKVILDPPAAIAPHPAPPGDGHQLSPLRRTEAKEPEAYALPPLRQEKPLETSSTHGPLHPLQILCQDMAQALTADEVHSQSNNVNLKKLKMSLGLSAEKLVWLTPLLEAANGLESLDLRGNRLGEVIQSAGVTEGRNYKAELFHHRRQMSRLAGINAYKAVESKGTKLPLPHASTPIQLCPNFNQCYTHDGRY